MVQFMSFIAGIAAGLAMMAAPFLFTISPDAAWWLFWGGVIVATFFGGLVLSLVLRRKPHATPSIVDQSVTSHRQSGGVTAHEVNVGHDQR